MSKEYALRFEDMEQVSGGMAPRPGEPEPEYPGEITIRRPNGKDIHIRPLIL